MKKITSRNFGPLSITNGSITVQIIPPKPSRSVITRQMRAALSGMIGVSFIHGFENRAHGRSPLRGIEVSKEIFPTVVDILQLQAA